MAKEPRTKMSGKEARYILKQANVNLSWLAEQIGITPQSMQSRLNAATSKRGCLCTLRITKNLKQFNYEYYYYLPLYTLPRARYTQKTIIESMMNPTIQPHKSILICSHLDSFFSTG